MLQIRCPWCGIRDEIEFHYRGDATVIRPEQNEAQEQLVEFVYVRRNSKGWNEELWHHIGGCRQFIKLIRHTVTHEIAGTGWPDDKLEITLA